MAEIKAQNPTSGTVMYFVPFAIKHGETKEHTLASLDGGTALFNVKLIGVSVGHVYTYKVSGTVTSKFVPNVMVTHISESGIPDVPGKRNIVLSVRNDDTFVANISTTDLDTVTWSGSVEMLWGAKVLNV